MASTRLNLTSTAHLVRQSCVCEEGGGRGVGAAAVGIILSLVKQRCVICVGGLTLVGRGEEVV